MVLGDCVLGAIGIILIVGIVGLFIIGEIFIIKDNLKNKKKRG